MNVVNKLDVYKQIPVSSERTFPGAPFPRKYVHSVFHDLQDAVQAFITLLGTGYDARDIHLMTGRDFVEAVEQRQTLIDSFCSREYEVYRQEADQGYHILSVYPASYGQMKQVRDLLAPYHAHHMKYVDTWTVTYLLA